MIALVNYGVGNLFSLRSSLDMIGAETMVTADADVLSRADHILLPGVGAFEDAAQKLRETKLDAVIREQALRGKPLLGVCLGMQMLFEKSYEYGEHQGLGLLSGSVIGMKGTIPSELKVPHIGWNALHLTRPHPLMKYVHEGDCVYFVHSYYAVGCDDSLIATTEYGIPLTAAAAQRNIMGCQFHPEKSGQVGLNILRAFLETKGV